MAFTAISHNSTLALNQSNHPDVPKEGLELPAGVPVTQGITPALAEYLKTLGVEIKSDPIHPQKVKE